MYWRRPRRIPRITEMPVDYILLAGALVIAALAFLWLVSFAVDLAPSRPAMHASEPVESSVARRDDNNWPIIEYPRNDRGQRDDWHGTCYAHDWEVLDGDACLKIQRSTH